MRKLRIRTYFLLSLVLLMLLPWLFFLTAHLITTQSLAMGENRPNWYTIHMAVFVGLTAAFILIGLRMRRHLLMPLERMSQAARHIAAGNWDVQLPESAIREIAEVRDGFDVMVDGLQASLRKQAELEEERRFLIAAIAHDLRTPLFALRGYLEGLEQGIAHTPEQIARYVAICKEKSSQLDRLVEDLFTFTRLEYVVPERFDSTNDFHAIVRASIDSVRLQAQLKHISIAAQYEPDPIVVRADSHLLERALSNLLDNAVRYTPARGHICAAIRREGDRAAFRIRDSGPGFAPEQLGRIFAPLYRGEQSRSRATGGAGLGLTIAQRILRQHGGELAADNHPDGGSLVSGWVPVAHLQ